MISIQYIMQFISAVTVLILTFSFTSCNSSKGSNDKLLLLGSDRQATTIATRVYGQAGSFTTGFAENGGTGNNPTIAIRVYGQAGSFTTGAVNNGGISATSLNGPCGVAMDGSGNLYVVEIFNHRVLYYPSGSTTATLVYGQGGSGTSFTTNTSDCSATSLFCPIAVAVDGGGNLYVADAGNNRVLYFPSGTATATRVYGQGSSGTSFTTNTNNNGGISATSLFCPSAVAVDGSGNLYVADQFNNRVLYYPSGSTTATLVYGQGGSGTSFTTNTSGCSATSLYNPSAVAVDSNGNLHVAEYQNNRVLYYAAGSITATRVYGQAGSFTTDTANNGGISATSLNGPCGVAVDSNGNLYVSDDKNNRVLYYPYGSTTATRVCGQAGSFTTGTANNGGISAASLNGPSAVAVDGSGNLYVTDIYNNRVLYYPSGISANSLNQPTRSAVDGSGNLYVADNGNNRVLYYPSGSTTATRVYGQDDSFTTNMQNNGGISKNSLYHPFAIAVDVSGNLYVSDVNNNRVLYYPSGSTTATRVYGQGDSFTTGSANNGGVSAASLNGPRFIVLDGSGNLYVADANNNRVLYYPSGSTTAMLVYGQGGSGTSFTTNTSGCSATSLYSPGDIAVDESGNLYVSDYQNNRVLCYAAGSITATRVYGQAGSFTTNIANNGGISTTSLYLPRGMAVDGSGNLYVADGSNNRVLYYASGSTTATRVYGQAGSFTTGTANNGGISAASLLNPTGVSLDNNGNLYVTDRFNNRVLYY